MSSFFINIVGLIESDIYLVKNISNCELFELSCPKALELIKMRGVGMLDNSDELKFEMIMQRVATIMEVESASKPYDKEIAYELGLSQTQYANNKARNKIPYKEISLFCDRHTITINWILLGRSSQKLIQREDNIYKVRAIDNLNTSYPGKEYDDEQRRLDTLEEGIHSERSHCYITIDRVKMRCYGTDYRDSEIDHYTRGVIAELECSIAVMVEMEFDINIGDYGVSLIYHEPEVSQPWDIF